MEQGEGPRTYGADGWQRTPTLAKLPSRFCIVQRIEERLCFKKYGILQFAMTTSHLCTRILTGDENCISDVLGVEVFDRRSQGKRWLAQIPSLQIRRNCRNMDSTIQLMVRNMELMTPRAVSQRLCTINKEKDKNAKASLPEKGYVLSWGAQA